MAQLDDPPSVTQVLQTAAAHASSNVPVVVPGQSVDQVLAGLRGHSFDSVAVIAVCRDGFLLGLATMERLTRRLWHRLPWLLVGLAGALLAAVIVGSFEAQLEKQVLIAFFIPGVVYLADAVGTQTETLVIRGLSVGVGIGRVALYESITGVLLGLLFAAINYPVVLLIWHQPMVAAAVSVALFAASSIATLIAMGLPWALQRLGRDPAFGSGPLATVIQDLLSITIYCATATLLVT